MAKKDKAVVSAAPAEPAAKTTPPPAAPPTTPETQAAPAPAVATEAPMTEEKMPETSIVKAEETAVATGDGNDFASRMAAKQALAKRLPAAVRGKFLMKKDRPEPEQLFEIVMALPPDKQERMMELVRKTRPDKQGAHFAKEGFSPTSIRLYQGTGTDPLRPADMPPGQYYTGDSRIIGKRFIATVLGIYEGRILWPLKGQQGAGDTPQGKAPLCVSLDQKKGSKYGDCASCPSLNKQYNQGGCTREIVAWLIDDKMTSIYELRFSKTSEGAGSALVKILQKCDNLWDRWFSFETQERTEEDRRWFVIKCATAVDDAGKQLATPKDLHPLFENLSRVLDYDCYYPQLANVYDGKAVAQVNAQNTAAETADEKALLGSSATEGTDNVDFSDGAAKPNV